MSAMVLKAHHVGLPSTKESWKELKAFWEGLGMRWVEKQIKDERYDPFGVGPRLQIYSGADLVVSYYVPRESQRHSGVGQVRCTNMSIHIAFKIGPALLDRARTHHCQTRETAWGHGNTSVFLQGPQDLLVELVTTDPSFHSDD